MKYCNCALPYSNPDACKTCSNGWGIPSDIWDGWYQWTNIPITYKITTTPSTGINYLYNPETHELVEKKEAKIKRLEKELELLNADVEVFNEVVVETSKEKSKALIKIEELTKELKQLK